MLIAFALRCWGLGGQSLWFDEGWSWHLAKLPLNEMALVTAGDRSPPLYYALLHVWIQLAGESEFAMRFPSALADTLTAALVMRFTAALVCKRAGAQMSESASMHTCTSAPVAGLIYAFMPLGLWYAQEVRMYALVAMLCTASSLMLWQWLRRVSSSSLVARHSSLAISGGLLVLAVYCHYYAIFLLPAQFIVALMYSMPRANRGLSQLPVTHYAIAAVGVITALSPWLAVASTGFAYDDGFFFPLNTIDGRLLEWLRGYASGGLAPPLPDWWPIALAVPTVGGVIGFASKRDWRNLVAVLALIVLPLLTATIAVRVVYPNRSVFHPRYLIYVAPVTAILFSGVLLPFTTDLSILRPFNKVRAQDSGQAGRRTTDDRRRRVGVSSSVVALGALWLPLTHAYLTDPNTQREDTRGATKHVIEALAPGDAVIMSRDNYAVRYYWRRVWQQTWAMDYDPASNILLAAPDGLHGILTGNDGIYAKLNDRPAEPLRRVRLMLWQDDVVDPQKFVESTLWPSGFELGEFNFAQIRLPLYQIDHWPMQPPRFVDVGAMFGDELALHSYWQRDRGVAGDWFYVTLNWQPRAGMKADYKVFVHVLDDKGEVAWQNDKLPLNPLLPMTRWQSGRSYQDAHAMVIPADAPAGRYQVVAGVYDPATHRRLTTQDGKDHAVLGEVEVSRR